MNKFQTLLNKRGTLLCDGATGTNYFKLGLETGHPPEFWCFEHPDRVLGLHQEFLNAGSDIILTNSFGGTEYRLKLHQAENRVTELNQEAAQIARKAVDAYFTQTGREALVAGSIGPIGELFDPLGPLDHNSAVQAFTSQAEALAKGGVDLLWIETISSIEEVKAAIEAAQKTGLHFVATMTFDTAGKSMMGVTPQDYASFISASGASALGANCGIGPAELMHSVLMMSDHATIPVVAKGNCGIPEYRNGEIHYHGSPELMGQYAVLARDAGVAIIGGCCGTTPQHIKAMRDALDQTVSQDTTSHNKVDLDRIASVLGKPWKDIPVATESAQSNDAQGRRRRRRRE